MKPSRELRNIVLGFLRDFAALEDAAMLAFPSARRGVECAVAVQQDVAKLD